MRLQRCSPPKPKVQPLDPTGQHATVFKKRATSLTGAGVPAEEPVSDGEQFSDRASSHVEEGGEVADLESSGSERIGRCGPGTVC